ncbi:MAG: hypothetical protein JEZ06_23760 [Anaerolineaceae bacterium]|nr:hypothetical protein [Anaerolineaceae bacterium]
MSTPSPRRCLRSRPSLYGGSQAGPGSLRGRSVGGYVVGRTGEKVFRELKETKDG